MRKCVCLLALSSIAAGVVGCSGNQANSKAVDVVVISGQSNAVGCTYCEYIAQKIGIEEYHRYVEGFPTIQIAFDSWTKDGWDTGNYYYYSQNKSRKENFVKVALGQGKGTDWFGPEIGIAEANYEKRANKLFLIKYACGGSNLKDEWLKRDSPMYPQMIEYVKLQMKHLKEKGYKPTIKAFCWMQGEGDAWKNYYESYYNNLKEFVGNVREDLYSLAGNKDVAFIDAGISNAPKWQYYKEINEAKAQFAAESDNNIYIDTIAAGLHTDKEPANSPDKDHYDSESQLQLGHLFAEAFEPFLMPIKK